MKIEKTMKIGDVLESAGDNVDKVAEVLFEAGMGCVGCPMAQMETLEEGMKAHGFSEEKIEEVIKKINKLK